jgi:hypothetical protein
MTQAEKIRQLEKEIACIRFVAGQMLESLTLELIRAKDKTRKKRVK